MNFLFFNLVSTIENIAAIILLLSIFKYRVLDYFPQTILSGLILSLISHTMRFEFNDSNWVPFVSIITLFLFIWIAFRVALFYALIISVVGYVAYSLIQAILVFILHSLGYLSLETAQQPYALQAYIMQLITSIVAFSISYLLTRKNYGFNWVPYSSTAKFKLTRDNVILIIVTIISVIVVGLVFYLFLSGYLHVFAIFVLFFIVLALLFYLARKQEEKYYD
jgi:hypothetical protein